MPSPKVDSVVIRLKIRKESKYTVCDEKLFFTVIKCAFSRRRKTALNSISGTMGVDKNVLTNIFDELEIDRNIRAENLTMDDFVRITEKLSEV